MKNVIKAMIVFGALLLWSGVMGGCDKKQDGEEVNSSGTGVEGKYYNKDDPEEYIELKADGTVFWREITLGKYLEKAGKWKVYGREIALISVLGDVERGQIQGDTIHVQGKVWDRKHMAELERRVETTRENINSVGNALNRFMEDMGRYPTQKEDILALVEKPPSDSSRWKGPYVNRAMLKDAWGNKYIYYAPYPQRRKPSNGKTYEQTTTTSGPIDASSGIRAAPEDSQSQEQTLTTGQPQRVDRSSNEKEFILMSLGADGKHGGEGHAQDIVFVPLPVVKTEN